MFLSLHLFVFLLVSPPPYICHHTRNWVDQKTFQIHPFSYFPLIESKIQINSICVFIAFLTSASEGLNVFIHVIKVVVNLLDPVGLGPVGPEDELVLIVQVLHVLVVTLVEALPLLFDGILEAASMVPNLQFAARHHKECLDIILQATALAA